MGLVARALEATGIPTVAVTAARDITAAVRPPRSVYVHAPLGWQIGMPGDADGQRRRLAAILAAGVGIDTPGAIVDLAREHPFGVIDLPQRLHHPDLEDWEAREYAPGYRTERTRRDAVVWPGARAARRRHPEGAARSTSASRSSGA